jgi:hypothetical protein
MTQNITETAQAWDEGFQAGIESCIEWNNGPDWAPLPNGADQNPYRPTTQSTLNEDTPEPYVDAILVYRKGEIIPVVNSEFGWTYPGSNYYDWPIVAGRLAGLPWHPLNEI